jgi:tetratricopeptide (TPR) repeat protein/Mg-chelatase subunit ChlD
MSFEQPWALALLLAVPVVFGLYAMVAWRRRTAMRRFAEPAQLDRLSSGEGSPRLLLRAALVATGMGFLTLAAAQPQWGSSEAETVRRGSDVVVVLDTSLSMAARDVEPDRLGKAREEVGSLIQRLQGDRVGLVVFAGESEVRFPLTDDDQAALAVVDELTVTPSLDEGSSLFDGLTAARELLADSEAQSRVIILVSDGENFGDAPIDAAFAAAQAGITIHTVGVGTEEGTTILVRDPETSEPTVKIDGRTGDPVITRLDPTLLQSIADVGGGRFIQLSNPGDAAAGALANEIRNLAQTNFSTRVAELPVERFQVFAAIAFALLLFERFVPERAFRLFARRRALLPVGLSLMLFIGASCSSTSFSGLIRDGNELFNDDEFSAALDLYREAGADEPDRAEADYNAANALYRMGNYDRAISDYLRALDVAEGSLVEDIYFNLGNAYFQSGLYDEAISAYREVLLRDPNHADAKFNLELALVARATGGGTAPEEGSAEPESNIRPDEEGQGETEESAGEEGQPGDEAEQAEEALEEALGEVGDEVSIEEALAILDELEELEPNEEGEDVDIVGIDDY